MNFSMNEDVLKKLASEPGHTVLEKQLVVYAQHLCQRIHKLNKDNVEAKFLLYSIQAKMLKNMPWIVDETLKHLEKSCLPPKGEREMEDVNVNPGC